MPPVHPAAPRYIEIAPGPALAPWVECFWSLRSAGASSRPNRVLPDGCADLIVGIAGLPGPVVVGTMRTAVVYPLADPVELFGIRFHPGAARRFLGVPLGELTDRRVPLADLWGSAAGTVADALEPAAPETRAARAEAVLRRLLETRTADDEALATRGVALLRRARGGVGVRETAAALGVGERRLERAFQRTVGLSPKVLARVLRFRQVVRAIAAGGSGRGSFSWAAVAFAAGYADQSHFIREFKALAGVTPARYAAEQRAVGFVQYPGRRPRAGWVTTYAEERP